jgi:hypothetical protein
MNPITKTGLYNALGTLVYIVLVSLLLQNGEKLFGNMSGVTAPVTFLSLFTLSAAVVGGLIIGKPVMLYLDNKKKEAVSLFIQTVSWLAGATVVLLAIQALVK